MMAPGIYRSIGDNEIGIQPIQQAELLAEKSEAKALLIPICKIVIKKKTDRPGGIGDSLHGV